MAKKPHPGRGQETKWEISIENGATGVDSVSVDGIRVMREGGKSAAIAGCRDTGNLGRGYIDDTFFAGDLAEVIVYERALSDKERLLVER